LINQKINFLPGKEESITKNLERVDELLSKMAAAET